MRTSSRYLLSFVAAMTSLLAGASVVHATFKPNVVIPDQANISKRKL